MTNQSHNDKVSFLCLQQTRLSDVKLFLFALPGTVLFYSFRLNGIRPPADSWSYYFYLENTDCWKMFLFRSIFFPSPESLVQQRCGELLKMVLSARVF